MLALALDTIGAGAATLPPSTWVQLSPLPQAGHAPIFGLAVDPANDRELIAGNASGGLYRSLDGGSSWALVHAGPAAVSTIGFNLFNPAIVLAGTRGGGALVSRDQGVQWTAVTGLDGRSVRAFGFSLQLMLAATDHGVYRSADGLTWSSSGLATTSLDAITVTSVNVPIHIVVGGDGGTSGIPMFQSADGGATWAQMSPPISGTIVTSLTAGPVPPNSDVRPLVVGTNAGAFITSDGGATFSALSGGALLPSTDYTQAVFAGSHFDRFYIASDGGGGNSGGVWATADSGLHFAWLSPPLRAVTALTVSRDEQPILYVATLRTSDQAPILWAFQDTGGTPVAPAQGTTPSASGARAGGGGGSLLDFLRSLGSSQAPYIALGAVGLGLIVLAVVAQLRSRRR